MSVVGTLNYGHNKHIGPHKLNVWCKLWFGNVSDNNLFENDVDRDICDKQLFFDLN